MSRKLLLLVCAFLVIYTFNFFLPRLMPGDPFAHNTAMSGQEMQGLSKAELARLKAYYGLDKPLWEQFKKTIKDNLQFNFGQSILYKKSVAAIITSRLPWTLYIMVSTLIISLLLGVLLALLCLQNSQWDTLVYKGMSLLAEIPAYLVGILLLFLVAARVKAIPLAGNLTPFYQHPNSFSWLVDVVKHSLLPISALVITMMPSFYFTARTSMQSIMTKEYVLNAYAKGLSAKTIRYKYVLLNAIFPLAARFFLNVGHCIGGTMLIENVFAYPGLGKVLRDAVMYRDFILIQGVFLLSTTVVLISSFISDLINYYLQKG
ncbi:MAG TPA: ABC transporter permease [Oscillospiraceae bacterium]|nr:ABC transporter permease [Oscillospiraceae bacterium]